MSSPTSLLRWTVVQSQAIFDSRWLRLRRDVCRLPSGRELDDYYVVEVPDGVAVVALTPARQLVLVRQYKHGLGQIVLELPAGIVEPGENPEHTMLRELREETGYTAPALEHVATLATKPARMAARTWVYFAPVVEPLGEQQRNDAEVIDLVLLPLSELPALLQRGEIITETSLAALLLVWPRLYPAGLLPA